MSKERDEKMAEIMKPEFKKPGCADGTHTSPSGKYTLEVCGYAPPQGWGCTQGTVRKGDEVITVVNRNYGAFPFAWCEEHPDGHDYLICGETYMGQTLIQLDTGKREDYNTPEGQEGFCWASFKFSKDKTKIAIDGCYWACPYMVWVVDFDWPRIGCGFKYPEETWDVLVRLEADIEEIKWNDDNDLELIGTEWEKDAKKAKMVWRSPKLEVLSYLEEKGEENVE